MAGGQNFVNDGELLLPAKGGGPFDMLGLGTICSKREEEFRTGSYGSA